MATVYRQQVAALCDGLVTGVPPTAQIRGLIDRLTIQPTGEIVV